MEGEAAAAGPAAAPVDGSAGRGGRPLLRPRAEIERVAAAKLLDAWLQRRGRVAALPGVAFERLDAAGRGLMLQMAATALLASGPVTAERRGRARAWLRGAGAPLAGDSPLPVPLPDLPDQVKAAGLAGAAFAVAVALTDRQAAAGRLWLDWLAARLELPAPVARGMRRRFGP